MKNAKDLYRHAIQSLAHALAGYERGRNVDMIAMPEAEIDRYRSTVEAMFPVFRCHILRELTYLPDQGLGPLHHSPLGVIDIANERRRQVEVEGFTAGRDDGYTAEELARAAGCYLTGDAANWPWTDGFTPRDRRRNLVKAGALIAAEIDRLDRLAESSAFAPPREGE